jgi:hypothetical protein
MGVAIGYEDEHCCASKSLTQQVMKVINYESNYYAALPHSIRVTIRRGLQRAPLYPSKVLQAVRPSEASSEA